MFGIQGIEIYFPKTYVDQSEFQSFNQVSSGKYTKGLGQLQLSFTYPCEDINSICLTVVANLMRNYGIDSSKIGRLEVGTQTLIDKSKSTKTVLMDLFKDNCDIEGATSINACYGGTNALLNTLNWITSPSWDGRYGIVVAADIAVYQRGPARCTGGAGAVALLIGPNALITIGKERSSCMENQYDFFKPNPNSQYPIVDGKISIDCYLNALEKCYLGLKKKRNGQNLVAQADFFCFHSPFYKMVQKAFTKMNKIEYPHLSDQKITEIFMEKVHPCMLLPQRLGNIYTGSLYSSLISLLLTNPLIQNKKVLMFSYGSGLCSTLFSLNIEANILSQQKIQMIMSKLSGRIKVQCSEYDRVMNQKQINFGKFFGKIRAQPKLIQQNTYYLTQIDKSWRRKYALKDSNFHIEANPISSLSSLQRLEHLHKVINKDDEKFYKLSVDERISKVNQNSGQRLDLSLLRSGGLEIDRADSMIENVIGKISLPLAVIPQFKINNKIYMIPMSIEESSVVAACSSIGKFLSNHPFQASSTQSIMIGQVHLTKAEAFQINQIKAKRQNLISIFNQMCPAMIKRGGGVIDIKIRQLEEGKQFSVDIHVNVCEVMGANIVNTICEKAKNELSKFGVQTGIAILSNLCTERKAYGSFQIPVSLMGRKGIDGEEVVKKILEAYDFALKDQYRAATHNKGIMNGIDAVCLATGQDWRAVEAAAHSYASRSKRYSPLTHYEIIQKKGRRYFKGSLELPIAVGTIGGVLGKNDIYKQSMQIMGNPNVQQLSQILVCVGLAQNFAALRALAVQGIQNGHMKLHAKALARSEGVPQDLIQMACEFMSQLKRYDKKAVQMFLNGQKPRARL